MEFPSEKELRSIRSKLEKAEPSRLLPRNASKASQNLGHLNGLTSIISDPDLFVYLYVRKEALLSSQTEGTQCSLEDILQQPVDQD